MPNPAHTTIALEPAQADDKGKQLIRLIETDFRDRYPLLKKRQYVRAIYHGDNQRIPRYEGQTNIHLHVMTEKIEGLVPKISNAFWNAEPHVHVRRVAEEFDEKETNKNELFLNWAIDADVPDFFATTEMWFRNELIDGTSVVKTWWNYETRKTVIIEAEKIAWRQGETDLAGFPVPEARLKTPLEILLGIFGNNPPHSGITEITDAQIGVGTSSKIEPTEEQETLDGLIFDVSFLEDRILYEDVRVEFYASGYVDEVDVYIYRPIITKNNVEVENVEFEDLIVPYRTKNLQDAERIAHQYWLTPDEVERKMKSGEWILTDEDMERVRACTMRGERHEEATENRSMKRQKDMQVGETGNNSTASARHPKPQPFIDNKILVFEVYAKDDILGDGSVQEVIYQIPYCLKKVVKAQYLEELFPHGRRPFAALQHIKVSNRFYGFSYGELLAPINVEVNAIINMVNEAQELINNPFFFYVPSSNTVDPEVLTNIEPGQGIPVADIQGVMFPSFPQQPLANLSAMDTLLLFADRLTISPQSTGSSQVRNSPRTARGTLALLSEAGIKTDMLIQAAQHGGWKELMHQVHALYAAFGPEEKFFHVTGESKPIKISNKELRGRFEYAFSGNTVNTNREITRSIAQVRYNTLVANPLYATDLSAMLALVRDFASHFSEGTDYEKLLPKIPGQGGTHPPFDQVSENRMMANGMPIDALPLDNHAQHIDVISKFQMGKEFEFLEPGLAALFAQHFAQHVQLLQVQQAQGSVPGGGTTGNNIPTGITQGGGTDLGALQGGNV